MRRHIDNALKNTLQRLESYFQMREANRATFARSLKKQVKFAQTENPDLRKNIKPRMNTYIRRIKSEEGGIQ